ncbi:hypothetical protein CES85_3756 (plasmid) [Ochrobactrum quorumnocens]|uniref:Uncharacterized protein n=1 Tax=Ochrobactrum quorumnocens TaxID=271865 RepID=A0A248UPQ7_9HYPH|nr:hypothetical protein CES85_3756 [[Ochrobactrum] quorumnocens]
MMINWKNYLLVVWGGMAWISPGLDGLHVARAKSTFGVRAPISDTSSRRNFVICDERVVDIKISSSFSPS